MGSHSSLYHKWVSPDLSSLRINIPVEAKNIVTRQSLHEMVQREFLALVRDQCRLYPINDPDSESGVYSSEGPLNLAVATRQAQ